MNNKYTFKNGAEVSGTVEQILSTAKALGETVDLSKLEGPSPTGYYKSSSKGLLKIGEMNEMHLRNAIIKETKNFYETLRKKKIDNNEFLNEYIKLADDSLVNDLYAELSKRK